MLDSVVGRGGSTVVVTADVNPESAERLEETFDAAEDAPALRESSSTENYTGTGGGAAGVLGPDNIAVPGGGDGEGTYTAETEELENAISKVTETTTVPPGALNSQSISVAVDENAAAGLDMPVLTAMVTDAVGLNEERGDALNVSIVPFSTADADAAAEALAEAEAEAAAEAQREQFQQILTSAVIAGALLLLLLAALLILRRRRKQQTEELEDLGESYPYEALGRAKLRRQPLWGQVSGLPRCFLPMPRRRCCRWPSPTRPTAAVRHSGQTARSLFSDGLSSTHWQPRTLSGWPSISEP